MQRIVAQVETFNEHFSIKLVNNLKKLACNENLHCEIIKMKVLTSKFKIIECLNDLFKEFVYFCEF